MFKGKLKGRTTTVAVAASAALAVGGAGAWATIPGPAGQVSSCYDTTTGAMRVVDSDAPACKTTEKALTFNQRGPAGPTGIRGPQGAPGPAQAHWAKFSGDNRLVAASQKPAASYPYGAYGYNYVAFTGVDPRRCSVTVTPGTVGTSWKGVTGNYYVYETASMNYVFAYTADAGGNFVKGVPMDVLVNCSDTTFVP